MQLRNILLLAAAIAAAGAVARAQDANAQGTMPVIKAETRLVLVDAVVTDKKGQYVRDLEQKNFKVWEDNKEQKITSFSFEADPNSPNNNQKHYMVLLFDNSTMDFGEQMRARQAAAQFIDANAGPNRLMAIINYAGSISVAQNFTADANRLKKVVSGVKFFAGLAQCAGRSGVHGHAESGQRRGVLWCLGRVACLAQHGQAAGSHTRPQDGSLADLRFSNARRDYVGVDRRDCRVQSRQCGDLPD